MGIYKSQSGFTPIHLLLLLVIFGIIGFAGWKVYDVSKTVNQSEATPASAAQKADPKVPEGFVEYKNEEIGFKFAYPKAWGEVSVERLPGYKSTKSFYTNQPKEGTKELVLNFAGQEEVQGSLRSKNYVGTPLKESSGAKLSYCKIGNVYVLSHAGSTETEKFLLDGTYMDNYVADGKEECSSKDYALNDVVEIGPNAIFIPAICSDRHGCSTNNMLERILIIKTGLAEFPGLKFITNDQAHNEVLKKIAPTYQKL